jgi:hypothetical protein
MKLDEKRKSNKLFYHAFCYNHFLEKEQRSKWGKNEKINCKRMVEQDKRILLDIALVL